MSKPERVKRPAYASPAKVRAYLELFAGAGHTVVGLELLPDRSIRILASSDMAEARSENPYDEWKLAGN